MTKHASVRALAAMGTVAMLLAGALVPAAYAVTRAHHADVGGMAVVQDPHSAEVPAMPDAALRLVPTARVFPLERIGPFLATLPPVPRGAPNGA